MERNPARAAPARKVIYSTIAQSRVSPSMNFSGQWQPTCATMANHKAAATSERTCETMAHPSADRPRDAGKRTTVRRPCRAAGNVIADHSKIAGIREGEFSGPVVPRKPRNLEQSCASVQSPVQGATRILGSFFRATLVQRSVPWL